MECIPANENDIPHIKRVIHAFSDKIGDEVTVVCKIVHEIPHDRGKLRFVVSERHG